MSDRGELPPPLAEQQTEDSVTPPPRPRMKPPKPSTYDPEGSDPEALESWLDQMNSYFVLAEIEETKKNEKVLTASFYITGRARDWYRTEKAKLTAWAEFETRMKSHFILSNYHITLVQLWDKLGWRKGQTIADYSNEIKSLALKLGNKTDEDKVHKLVFKGNSRLITQLVTQMGTTDADATAEKYGAIEKIALNLEEAVAIADVARPQQRQFHPRAPASGTSKRTVMATTESNWRSPTPNRATTPSSSRAPNLVPFIPDPIPYGLSEAEYLRLREAKACFYCKKEKVDPSHNWKSCPKRLANLGRIKQEEVNDLADESSIETVPTTMPCHPLGEEKINERDGSRKVLPPRNRSEVSRPQVSRKHPELSVVDKDTQARVCQPSSSVPPIIVSATLDNHAVRGPADTGASSNFISPRVVKRANFCMHPMPPSLLRQALSKTPVQLSKQVVANVKLADPGIKIKTPSTFKVAPLTSHEVIFRMPFLAENDLLVDPVARKLVPRPCDLNNYVKVGKALMELPAPEAQLEEVNFTEEEPPEYASLNDFFRKEFPDVFTLKRGGRLPPKGGPMHRIVLKDEKKPINGRLLCVPAKYYLPMRRFILENVRCGRLRPSTSHISSGTLMVPRSNPKDDLRMVHDY